MSYEPKLDSRAPLSDAEMDELEKFALVPDRAMQLPTMRVRRMLHEIRERRAQDLTLTDRALLGAVFDLLKRRIRVHEQQGLVGEMMTLLARLVNGVKP